MKTKMRLLLAAAFLFCGTFCLAQQNPNLIPTNVSNFNIGTVGNGHSSNNLSNANVATDYTYTKDYHGLMPASAVQHYAVGTNAQYYNHQTGATPIGSGETGFFDLPDHTTGTGNYMIVNGATSSNKRVWEYTVNNLIVGVRYDFKAYVTCLFMSPLGYVPDDYLPKLQLKINDVNVGSVNTVPWVNGGSWTSWSNYWAATSTSAKITIIDNCTKDNGNDFGIDDISFRKADGYVLQASAFSVSFCGACEPIDLTGHITVTAPTGDASPPLQVKIRKSESYAWSDSISTYHGTAYVGSDNKIYYTSTPGYHGTDAIQYQISRFGQSVWKSIAITVSDAPTLTAIQNFPADGHLCLSSINTFSPSATWNNNGSAMVEQGWEWKASNSNTWNPSSTFNSSNIHVGNYNIQFYAFNACNQFGSASISDPMLLRVCDAPVLSTTSIMDPPVLCGSNASLPASYFQQVTVSNWNNDEGTARWEVSHNNGNTWLPFAETTLSPNDKLRFHAFNQCGDAYTSVKTVTINNGPTFSQSTPTFDTYYCSGAQLVLPSAPSFNDNGITVNDQYWAYSADGGITFSRINGNPTLTEAWDGRYLCYVLSFNCGGTPSIATSDPLRQLTVYGAPEFVEDLPEIGHSFCVGDYLATSDLQAPAFSGSPDVSTYWEISNNTSPNGTYTPFTLPRQLTISDNHKWIRLHAVGCGESTTNSVQLQVNDAPTIVTPAVPAAICAGNSFTLVAPNVQNDGTLIDFGWQVSPTQNGSYISFDNNEVPYSSNGYWIRYFAENECGIGYSQPVQITVNDLPEVGNITEPPAICAGDAFTLTAPTVDWRHVTPGNGSWEIADPVTGEFQPLNNSNISYAYNGCLIRYKAENGCGTSYSPNSLMVTVYSTDPVYEDTIVACDVMEHHGVNCNHTGPFSATIQSPDGCDITAYWYFVLGDAYEAPTVRDTVCNSYYWPRTHRYYYTSGSYDTTIVSTNPLVCDSVFTLNIVINHAPVITNVIPQSQVQPICDGQNLNFPTPTVTWNYLGNEIEYEFWEASSSPTGEYSYFPLENVSYDYDQWYVRYHAMNECGEAVSDPVQISVRRSPVIVTQVPEMASVCAGDVLPLPSMTVNWYGETGTEGWYLGTPLGNAVPIDENTPMQFNYNGWTLYYQATNSCGDIVSNERTITVNNIPTVPEIPPVAGVCAGGAFDLPEMNPEWNGSTGQGVWQIAETPAGPFTNLANHSIPYGYNNWWLRYKATNVCGSDTSRMVQVQVYPSDDLEETMQACHPMHIYGFDCDHDDDYVKDSITEYGCEVTFTLHFSLGEQFVYPTEMVEECDAYYWEKFHKWFTEDANFDTLISGGSANACDTLYSIQVDITHSNPLTVIPEQHCTSFFWDVNGLTYTESTTDTFFRANGPCTDTLVLRLTIAPLEDESSVVMCQDYFWPEAGLWIEVGGTADTVMFDAETGCDVHYLLHVVEGSDIGGTSEPVSTCEPYYWHGNYYQESGVYTFNNEDPVTGCHVVDTLRLEVNGFSDFDIQGSTQVAVATSYWPGVYYYTVDVETEDPIHWQLLDADWAYDTLATGKTCWVEVSSTGMARLVARLGDGGCNSDTIYINATQFAVDEQEPLPLNIYPNPAKHQVTIESENIRQVKVYDMLGQLVRAYSCQGDPRMTFDVSEFAASFYVVEVRTDRGIARKALSVYR